MPTQSALAHTKLVSSTPTPNATLSALPRSVELTFNEELLVLADKETGSISVTNAAGERFDIGQLKVRSRALSIGLLESDTYGSFSVEWRAVAQDGHPVEGKFAFAVIPKASGTSTPTPFVSDKSVADLPIEKESSLFGVALLALLSASTAFVLLRRRIRNH